MNETDGNTLWAVYGEEHIDCNANSKLQTWHKVAMMAEECKYKKLLQFTQILFIWILFTKVETKIQKYWNYI